jgi:hypothetical protein
VKSGTKVPAVFFQGTGGDLGGGNAPIPAGQLKEGEHAEVELLAVLVGIAVFYNVPGSATSIRLVAPQRQKHGD